MPNTVEELNPKQELFCHLYAENDQLFGNGTLAYAEAYDYDLDSLSRDDAEKDEEGVIIRDSSYDRAYNTCSVNSHKLLRNAKIQERVRKLLNELMRDDVVDSELVKIIRQNYKLEAKISAIKEYNKLRNRIRDNIDVTLTSKVISVDE